jgi:polyphosphate glucokinase
MPISADTPASSADPRGPLQAPGSTPTVPPDRHPLTLAIDVGGTGLKALVLDARGAPICDRDRIRTPRPATPRAILDALKSVVAPLGPFDRISAGFPGVVLNGVVKTAPNLDPAWAGIDLADRLARLFKKPARVLNDAGVQGFGIMRGIGLEMVLTLGTGLGCALFYEGTYIPNLELGHHPFRKGKTYEDYLGARGLAEAGPAKWNRHLARAIAQIDPVWNPDRIYLGGGNAKHVESDLPPHVQIASNTAGLLGGIALWDGREGLELSKVTSATKTAHPAALRAPQGLGRTKNGSRRGRPTSA